MKHLPARRTFEPREYGGATLKVAAHLDAACPGFLLSTIYASCLKRQALFAAFAVINLDATEVFASRLEAAAPDVFVGLDHLDSSARIARSLVALRAKRIIEATFGECPPGLLGAFARLGSEPLDPKVYGVLFDVFSDPRHRHRASVLGQLPGLIHPDHIKVVTGLDDALVHLVAVERTKPAELTALNAFAGLIADLCNATPEAIKRSLDKLKSGTNGVGMGEWVQGWLGRQVRLPFDPPIPANDPDFRLCLGVELTSLGRRLRNCAGQRQSYTFLGERLVYEVVGFGEPAALELLRLTTGAESKWVCEDLRAPRNRRVSAELAAAVQFKLDHHGILYQSLEQPTDNERALHKLLDHTTPFAWDRQREAADDAHGDADIDRMLEQLQQEIDQEAA